VYSTKRTDSLGKVKIFHPRYWNFKLQGVVKESDS